MDAEEDERNVWNDEIEHTVDPDIDGNVWGDVASAKRIDAGAQEPVNEGGDLPEEQGDDADESGDGESEESEEYEEEEEEDGGGDGDDDDFEDFEEYNKVPEEVQHVLAAPDIKVDMHDIETHLTSIFDGISSPQSKIEPMGNMLDIDNPTNSAASARKLMNQFTRPTRQFICVDSKPEPIVRWRASAVEGDVLRILQRWKEHQYTKSRTALFGWARRSSSMRQSPRPQPRSTSTPRSASANTNTERPTSVVSPPHHGLVHHQAADNSMKMMAPPRPSSVVMNRPPPLVLDPDSRSTPHSPAASSPVPSLHSPPLQPTPREPSPAMPSQSSLPKHSTTASFGSKADFDMFEQLSSRPSSRNETHTAQSSVKSPVASPPLSQPGSAQGSTFGLGFGDDAFVPVQSTQSPNRPISPSQQAQSSPAPTPTNASVSSQPQEDVDDVVDDGDDDDWGEFQDFEAPPQSSGPSPSAWDLEVFETPKSSTASHGTKPASSPQPQAKLSPTMTTSSSPQPQAKLGPTAPTSRQEQDGDNNKVRNIVDLLPDISYML